MTPPLISLPMTVTQKRFCCLELQCWERRWENGFGGEGQHREPLSGKAGGGAPHGGGGGGSKWGSQCWWEVVSTQDGLLKETVPCLVFRRTPASKNSFCALNQRKDAPNPPDLRQGSLREGSKVTGVRASIPACGGVKW